MKKLTLLLFALFFIILPAYTVHAIEIVPSTCSNGTASISSCGLDELMQVFVNIYEEGIKYVGAVTLLFFVIGGFFLLTSGGSSERIELGKKTLVGATIGLLLVLGSFVLVTFIEQNILGADTQYAPTPKANQTTGN